MQRVCGTPADDCELSFSPAALLALQGRSSFCSCLSLFFSSSSGSSGSVAARLQIGWRAEAAAFLQGMPRVFVARNAGVRLIASSWFEGVAGLAGVCTVCVSSMREEWGGGHYETGCQQVSGLSCGGPSGYRCVPTPLPLQHSRGTPARQDMTRAVVKVDEICIGRGCGGGRPRRVRVSGLLARTKMVRWVFNEVTSGGAAQGRWRHADQPQPAGQLWLRCRAAAHALDRV